MKIQAMAVLMLLALAPAASAEPAPAPKPEEPRKAHTDPRFKGKVMVIGTSSASFGEAPKGEELKTRGLDDYDPAEASPRPMAIGEPEKPRKATKPAPQQ